MKLSEEEKKEIILDATEKWLKDMHKMCDTEYDWYAGLAKAICTEGVKNELLKAEVNSLKAIVVDLNKTVLEMLGDR